MEASQPAVLKAMKEDSVLEALVRGDVRAGAALLERDRCDRGVTAARRCGRGNVPSVAESLHDHIERLLVALTTEARRCYGDRLVSLVVFGSMGRGTARPDSDVDLLVVADGLPQGRRSRLAEFETVEAGLGPALTAGRRHGFSTECSPVFKTREELRAGSPLFLDMVEDARVLHDPEGVFADARAGWRDRLARLGARRIWRGNAWLWDLKPDYQPGDVFEL